MYVRRWHPVAPGRCRRYTVPMTEPDQTPETPPPDEAPRDEPAPAPAAPRVRRGRWWLALLFVAALAFGAWGRSEEQTSELQSLMRLSYTDFSLNKKMRN